MERLVINSLTREKRFAYIKNDKVERLYIEQPNQQSAVGSIFLGTVEKVVPGMNAAFVNIGEDKSGFLTREKVPAFVLDERGKEEKAKRSISSYLHQGEKLLVQVEKDAAGTKGPRLTGIIEFSGDALIYMPSGKSVAVSKKIKDNEVKKRLRSFGLEVKTAEEGILFRTSAVEKIEDDLMTELQTLRERYRDLEGLGKNYKKPGLVMARDFFYEELIGTIGQMKSGEVIVDELRLKKQFKMFGTEPTMKYHNQTENIFSAYGLEKEIEQAMKKVVLLENGAYLIFDEAEALTIIDVNTGKYSGKNDLQATVVTTNKLAAKEIARQLRLRDLGGMILIDFIDMKNEEDRQQVSKVMAASLAEDGRRTRIIGFTELGILQLTRNKTKISITEALTSECLVCNGTGRVSSAESMAFRLERELWELKHSDHEAVLIDATKEVVTIFSGENDVHRQRIEEGVGIKILWSIVNGAIPDYALRQFGSIEELARKIETEKRNRIDTSRSS